jgi:hypothetical protein
MNKDFFKIPKLSHENRKPIPSTYSPDENLLSERRLKKLETQKGSISIINLQKFSGTNNF